MKLGVHDQHCPSALAVVYAWGIEKGYEIVDYDTLPDSFQAEMPSKFLINPILPMGGEVRVARYWEDIRRCVRTNPQTYFGMIIPSLMREEMDTARTALMNLENVTYFGFGDTEKLFDFLQPTAPLEEVRRN